MAKAQQKTLPTKVTVKDFLNTVEDETQREDSFAVTDMMQKATKLKPVMWGPAIIGFGKYSYKYESGREGDAPLMGFSPRKGNLTLYIDAHRDEHKKLITKLGKYKLSGSCLHIKKLSDIDEKVLKEMMDVSFKNTVKRFKKLYGESSVSLK